MLAGHAEQHPRTSSIAGLARQAPRRHARSELQGTDDLRESPLVIMAERFIGKGLLSIYDPQVHVA